MNFAAPPAERPGRESWRGLLVFPQAAAEERSRPRIENQTLRWDSFEEPFSLGLRFEKIDEVQVEVGAATSGFFDLGIALVDPDGSQRRFVLLRLRPSDETPEPVLLMRSNEKMGISIATPLPPVPRLLGQGPYTIFLQFQPGAAGTRLSARIDRKKDGYPIYKAACELEGTDWASGVLVLQAKSPVKPFSVALDRVVISGQLARPAGVEGVPWRS
jgi:hypothetical protein